MSPPSISARDWALILILSIIWGGAFFFNVIILRDLPTNTLVFWRMAIAALPLVVMTLWMKTGLPRGWATWRSLGLLAALNIVIPFILFTWAQTRIPSGFASVLNATTPLWGVVVAHFLTDDEKATPLKVIGVLTGLAGVTLMTLPSLGHGLRGTGIATLACVSATICYGFASIVAKRLNFGGMTPLALTTGQAVCATAIMLPIMVVVDRPWTLAFPGNDALLALLALALVSTALAYWFYFKVLESAGATNSLLITFLIPVTAYALSNLYLGGETITLAQGAGIALIALGLVILDGRLFARKVAET